MKDPFPALSHWFGVLLSIAALVALMIASDGRPWLVVSFAIYGTTLILLYLASALTHSIRGTQQREAFLDKLDYSAIFLLIAGTYTPLCLIPLRGWVGWTLLGIEWSLAVIGIIAVVRGNERARAARAFTYVLMAWICVLFMPMIFSRLTTASLLWLFAGGIVYSLGAIVFVTNRPNFWPQRFVAHDLWHVMVLVGSGCHFMVMMQFLG